VGDYRTINIPIKDIERLLEEYADQQVDAPEDSPAIAALREAFHKARWTDMERENMLDRIAVHVSGTLCELLAIEIQAEPISSVPDREALLLHMHDDSSGISFRTMLADDISSTLKGVLNG
jgi:hypothetical protein